MGHRAFNGSAYRRAGDGTDARASGTGAELDKEKFRPIVCLSKKTEILDLYKNAGIKTYLINMERIKKHRNPLFLLKLLVKFIPTVQALRKIIQNEQVDIIHGNDLLDIYGPIAGKLSKIPTVQHCRMILFKASLIILLFKNFSNFFVVNNNSSINSF